MAQKKKPKEHAFRYGRNGLCMLCQKKREAHKR